MPGNSQQNQSSEFAQRRWAIINAETCAATDLSYDEAVALIRELEQATGGLCIVTNAVAERLCGGKIGAVNTTEPKEDLSQKSFSEML